MPHTSAETTDTARTAFLERNRWVPLVLPLAIFMAGTEAERRWVPPLPDDAVAAAGATPSAVAEAAPAQPSTESDHATVRELRARRYPLVYSLKIAAVIASVVFCWPAYRQFGPVRCGSLAVGVGIVGVVLWVGLCLLGLETRWLPRIGLGWIAGEGKRAGFNPLAELASGPLWAWTFLGIRFLGLAAVVPLVEEVFLRGFLMRFATRSDWWRLSLGEISASGVAIGTAVAVATHPAELLAAAVWFSLVTWLMFRTRNLWDCVAAHAVTNLLLGIYVVISGHWELM